MRKMKRFLCYLLLFSALLELFSGSVPVRAEEAIVPGVAAAEALEEAVERQVRAYAKSIDQANADSTAAKALASHGIFGGGKKLTVGENHALTATLWNSELLQATIIDCCTSAIQMMQQTDLLSLPYTEGAVTWADNFFEYMLRTYTAETQENKYRDWTIKNYTQYTGKLSAYDSSLIWTVGHIDILLQIERIRADETNVTYNVTVTVSDRFDFHSSSSSGFDDLLSGFGALLFKEFDWEAPVNFDLKVPYSCTHTTGSYHWSYDSDNHTITSDDSGNYIKNDAIKHTFITDNGYTHYYYELSETIRLYHDQPWALEYDVQKASNVAFAPFENSCAATQPTLVQARNGIYSLLRKYRPSATSVAVDNMYGVKLSDYYTSVSSQLYTFRLENKILLDGSNQIYLTVLKTNTGEILVDSIPMDDQYTYDHVSKENEYISDSNNAMNGKDLYINYIGNPAYAFFDADYFDLRIWENGIDGGSESAFESKVTKPTCTTQGYTTHTCTLCGYSYQDDFVPALGHRFGEWEQNSTVSCTQPSVENRTCATCGQKQTNTTPAWGHDWDSGVVTLEPTISAEGQICYTCRRCATTRVDVLPKLEHPHVYETVVTPATCTTAGYSTHTCFCGDTYVDAHVAALGHAYEAVVTPPLCNAQGYTTYTCARCEDSYVSDYLNPGGHVYGDWIIRVEATCTTRGERYRACIGCGKEVKEVISATGHSYTETVILPTCTKGGYTEHVCHCGSSYVTDRVSPLGHREVVDEAVAATCTAPGLSEGKHCSVCDTVLLAQSVVPATGHSFGTWNVIVEATCAEQGKERRECTNCEHYEEQVVAALGHAIVKHEAKVPACTEIGWSAYDTCERCDYSTYVEISATGHSYETVVTAPTCTEQGYTTYICLCGDSYVADYAEQLPHNYEAVVTEPTWETSGYTTYTCTCGDSYVSDYTDPLPYVPGDPDGNGSVNTDDAIYLLYNVMFGDGDYPVNQDCDFDGNGTVNTDDAIYLLYHVMFGEADYPLHN